MATRQAICVHCNRQFEYRVGRGTDRSICSKDCANARRLTSAKEYASDHHCEVDGCCKPVRGVGSTICEMHYGRLRRNGTLENRKLQAVIEHTNGYLLELAPDHPLSKSSHHRVYQHRRVFYDAYGEGPFKCHVCGAEQTWETMHVDHLDEDRTNNDLSNLAAACPVCNSWRNKQHNIERSLAVRPKIIAFGESRCLSEWHRITGIPRTTIKRRIDEGWPPEKALSTPPGPTGRKSRA